MLSSVCPLLQPILEDLKGGTECVLVFSGFSDGCVSALNQLTKHGHIQLSAAREEDLQRNIKILRSDFQYIETQLPREFSKIQFDLKSNVKVPNNINDLLDDEMFVGKSKGKDPVTVFGTEENVVNNKSDADGIWTTDLQSVVFQGISKVSKTIRNLFRCCFCTQILRSGSNWKLHIKSQHKDKLKLIKGPFQCQYCPQKFQTVANFCHHLNSLYVVEVEK